MRPILIAIAILAASCGDDGPAYETVRDAVVAFSEAFCDRAVECGTFAAGDRATCEGLVASELCGVAPCSAEFMGTEEDVDLCLDVLDTYPCGTETIPPQCQGVIR